jgi:hypothetical protein
MNNKNNSETNKNIIELGSSFFDGFTLAARDALTKGVEKYAKSVRDGAARLQKNEQYGQSAIEITAAHVEMATQECERKPRRQRQSGWLWLVRTFVPILFVLVGIGGSNLDKDWGLPMLIITLVFAFALVFVERELTRES